MLEGSMRAWRRLGMGLLAVGGVAWLTVMAWPASPSSSDKPPRGVDARTAEMPRTMGPAAPLRSTSAGGLTLQGAVRGPRGPAPGARVMATMAVEGETLSVLPCDGVRDRTLLECVHGQMATQVRELVEERRGEALVQAEAVTAEDGSFELSGLEARPYALWVESAEGTGFRPGVTPGAEPVVLHLGPGSRLSGTVTDDTQAPVAGALVTGIFAPESRFFEALTDAHGRFELGPLPAGRLVVVIKKEGLLPAIEGLRLFGAQARRTFELSRPRRLTGRVLLSKASVAGVEVRAGIGLGEERSAVTDAQGRFAFEEIAPVSLTLSTWHAGTAAFARVEWEKDSRDKDVTLELRPAAVLEGVVRDEDGQPIEGAQVGMVWEGQDAPEGEMPGVTWTLTDAQGRYRLGPEHPGRYSLQVSERRFLTLKADEQVLGAGETRRDFTLKRAFLVEGQLVDPEGQPVPEEPVSLVLADSEALLSPDYGITGADGRFSLAVPLEGEAFVHVRGQRVHPLEVPVTVPSAPLRIVVEPLLVVEGEVVDEAGVPLPAVTVGLWGENDASKELPNESDDTDRWGRFTLRVASPGRYEVAAVLASTDSLRTTSRIVEVGGRETLRVRLSLSPGRRLSGVVVDWRGQPVPQALLQVMPATHRVERSRCCIPERSILSNAEGRFVFAEVPGEEVQLCVRKGDYVPVGSSNAEPRCLRVKNDGQELRVILGREVFVTGRLIHADGTPVKHFTVNGQEKRRDDGEFSIRVLQPGVEPISLSVPGGYSVQRTAPVFADGEVIQDLGSIVLAP